MFSKALKLVGLIGGGILALGTGAAGSYLAQPHLEPLLNPERKDREDRLQELFEEASKELELLEKSLNEAQHENETKRESISSLNEEVKEFEKQISEKDRQLSQKDEDIENKKRELQKQTDTNAQQEEKITKLNSDLSGLKSTLEQETKNKQDAEANLKKVIDRISLTSEDILTKPYGQDSLKINTRKTAWNSFSDGVAKFNTVDSDGKSRSFSVNQVNRTNHEQIAEEIKRKGITVKLASTFTTWDKIISITRYDIDYDFTTTNPNEKNHLVKKSKTTYQTIRLSEYFQSQYHEEAFKVLVAIAFLDTFPLCRDTSSSDASKPYLFCEGKNINVKFATDNVWEWPAFKGTNEEGKKFNVYLNSFVNIKDFIKYWTQKTVDFVKTGTVDLFDFLNPIFLDKSYQSS